MLVASRQTRVPSAVSTLEAQDGVWNNSLSNTELCNLRRGIIRTNGAIWLGPRLKDARR